MHSSTELRSSMFRITVEGHDSTLAELLPGFDERDRLGVVVHEPCGAIGASALITAAITAFYDIQRARLGEFFIYPDYFLFHVGRPLGDHSMLDVWPSHKEVVVPEDQEEILRAINDRGVTRLVVPDGEADEHAFERETLASARARIATCLAYSAAGRVRDGDIRIVSNPVTEGYVAAVLDPEALLAGMREDEGAAYADVVAARVGEVGREARARRRAERASLVEDGVPVETYRRVELDEALALL